MSRTRRIVYAFVALLAPTLALGSGFADPIVRARYHLRHARLLGDADATAFLESDARWELLDEAVALARLEARDDEAVCHRAIVVLLVRFDHPLDALEVEAECLRSRDAGLRKLAIEDLPRDRRLLGAVLRYARFIRPSPVPEDRDELRAARDWLHTLDRGHTELRIAASDAAETGVDDISFELASASYFWRLPLGVIVDALESWAHEHAAELPPQIR